MKVYSDAARDEEVVGLGWEIRLPDGETITGSRYILGNHTSMEGEYFALLEAIRFAKREDVDTVEVFCDCEPLVQKMRVPDDNADWYDRRRGCHRLLNKFDSWELEWMPRENNTAADRLAYEALQRGRQA